MRSLLYRLLKKAKQIIVSPISMIRGKKALRHLQSLKSEDEVLLVIGSLIGDSVYALALMGDLVKKSSKRIVLLCNEKSKWIVGLFSIDCKVLFYKEEGEFKRVDCFWGSGASLKKGFKKGVLYANPWYYKDKYYGYRPDISALDYLRHLLRDETLRVEFPMVSHQQIESIPNFEQKKGRIVVINPYTNSLYNKSHFSLFERISAYLINEGYFVFTNVIKEQEPIKGTEPLRCSLGELFSIAKQIPLVVSIRSGLLDFLVSSGVNMLVLFLSCSERFYQMYSVKKWFGEGKIEESFYSADFNPGALESKLSRLLATKKV